MHNSIKAKGAWIKAPHDNSIKATYFRGRFLVKKPIRSAILSFSALGLVEPWLNGNRIGEDWFTPGWSDYRKRAYLCRYNLTGKLRKGENCLGFILGNGWAGDDFGPFGHAQVLAEKRALVAWLEISYADGTHEVFATDTSWEARTGPITRQSIYHGETYDARLELKDWAGAGGRSSRRGWKRAAPSQAPKIELSEKKCPPVRITERLKPKKLWRGPDNEWLVDFGQNLVGVLSLRISKSSRGQRVTFQFAEMLREDGRLYRENLRHAEATNHYFCGGVDGECFTPRFTFHGFRYASITGLSAKPRVDEIEALVLHNDLEPTGFFSSSAPSLNRLQSCIRWGQRGNFLEAPTDCPQRDERLGWSGDAQVFVDTACFNYDCEGFYRQWMDAMRDGQREDGAFPDVAPDVLGWHGNAGWGDAGVIVPHAVWKHYGSTAIIEENWSAMVRYMDFLEKRANGYLQPITVYGDWLSVDAVKPQFGPTPRDLVGTAYFARDAQLMARMAGAIGKGRAKGKYRKLADSIAHAFAKTYITAEGLVLGDTQTAYLIALGFDLVPEKLKSKALERLILKLRERNWHLSTGFLGTPLLNPVLTRMGRPDVAYKLIFQKTYPSWLYPIENGATTMWERWNSWTREDGFGPVEMNSFNHYAYGAVGEWLYQTVAGIGPHPDFPGYRRARIAPVPGPGVKRARARLKTRQGELQIRWTLQKDGWHATVRVPEGAEAEIELPATKRSAVRMNGKQIRHWSRPQGTGVLVSSGDFEFHVRMDGLELLDSPNHL